MVLFVGVENPFFFFFPLFHLTETTLSGSQAFSRLSNSNTTSFCSEDSKTGSSEASMSVQSPGSLQQPSGRGSSLTCKSLMVIQKTCKLAAAHPDLQCSYRNILNRASPQNHTAKAWPVVPTTTPMQEQVHFCTQNSFAHSTVLPFFRFWLGQKAWPGSWTALTTKLMVKE